MKIADFGQSKLLGDLQDTLRTTQPGTIAYMPPEALKKKKTYTAKVDSFSLGVLLLEICIQNPPSTAWDGIGTIEEVKRREDDLRLLDDAHPLKPLIVWCLQYEELRPTVAGIHNHVNSVKASNKAIVSYCCKRIHILLLYIKCYRPGVESNVLLKNGGGGGGYYVHRCLKHGCVYNSAT